MALHNDKGNLLEDIVAMLHEEPNIKVEKRIKISPKDGNGGKREIDILLTANISCYPIQIAIECKNHITNVGAEEIDAFIAKLNYLGLAVPQAVFVSTSDYTKGAKDSAKKVGIKLWTLKGLAKNKQSVYIHGALQSIIYILPIYNKFTVISSIQDPVKNEHIIFYDKNKQPLGSIMDLMYGIWKIQDIPLTLGVHEFRIDIPDNWFNLYNDELICPILN